MKKIINKRKGFSVIEVIIYLAIFTMISLLVVNSLIVVMKTFVKVQTNHNILESGMNSMERMTREIRQSKSIDLPNSNLAFGVLQLKSTDKSGHSLILKFDDNASKLDLYQNGVLSGNLLNPHISLDNLIFKQISTANSQAVKIKMSIHDTRDKTSTIVNFYDTIILRGGY